MRNVLRAKHRLHDIMFYDSNRKLPQDIGLESLAESLEEHEIGGLLVVGGFEVSAFNLYLAWHQP